MNKFLTTYTIAALVLMSGVLARSSESEDCGMTLTDSTIDAPFVFSASAPLASSPCEGNNHDNDHYNPGAYTGGSMLAISWVPSSSVTVTRVEVFTGYGVFQNALAIWSDDGGNPSKPLEALSYTDSYQTVSEPSWQGEYLISPVSVTAGTKYWVVWDTEGFQLLSSTPDPGPQQTYWGSWVGTVSGGAEWRGPYSQWCWKFRMFCEYAEPPIPDIKANGSDDLIVVVFPGESVNVTISLDPGEKAGEMADWWGIVASPFGTFPLFTFQAPLFELPETSLIDIPLPPGWYTFIFNLDDTPDSSFDLMWYDYVTVWQL